MPFKQRALTREEAGVVTSLERAAIRELDMLSTISGALLQAGLSDAKQIVDYEATAFFDRFLVAARRLNWRRALICDYRRLLLCRWHDDDISLPHPANKELQSEQAETTLHLPANVLQSGRGGHAAPGG